MGMSELEWAVRDYCEILYDIEFKKNIDKEEKRQEKHEEIA